MREGGEESYGYFFKNELHNATSRLLLLKNDNVQFRMAPRRAIMTFDFLSPPY